MISSGDFIVENFQSIIENYEAALKDVTGELASVRTEHDAIKKALNDNEQLSTHLHKILAEDPKRDVEHTYKESDLIDNLKQQLQLVVEEKNQAIKLWQNAANTVEKLETELQIYEDNTEGFIPRALLIQLKKTYEEKLNDLQETVVRTKTKLEETINLKSKELQIKDKEIFGTQQSHDNTFKIIKNLEEEVLNLQQRLSEAKGSKHSLEKNLKLRTEETALLKIKVKDCRAKVEEALQLVDAALSEKDAALLREAEAREETTKFNHALSEFIDETDKRIESIKVDHETKLEQLNHVLRTNQKLVRIKESEVENYMKRCAQLEEEIDKLHKSRGTVDDTTSSKLLILEKNLESTFQKLLLSEKQNIQLKSETEAIKNDLEQMSQHYQRDINNREAQNAVLKSEIKKLKLDLDLSASKGTQSSETVKDLNEKILAYSEEIRKTKTEVQALSTDYSAKEVAHTKLVQELEDQLKAQTEMNHKWREETKVIIGQLEQVIRELKTANGKNKRDNKILADRLKDANLKMLEYRRFLEMISQDVTKITTITLPDDFELNR